MSFMKKYIISILLLNVFGGAYAQNTQQSPVDIGSKSAAFTYSSTLNTAIYTNNYTGRTANDVFYKLTLAKAMEVVINHCGSEVSDTYLHLLDSSGKLIVSNDDYSGVGKCTKTTHSYLKRVLPTGTYYVVSEGYSQNGNITTTITGSIPALSALPYTDAGSKSASFTYLNTQNTVNTGNYYLGASANDVLYRFTLTKAMDITISHSGSTLSNTYIHLLNSSGTVNTSYQTATLKKRLPAGTYYLVSEGNATNGQICTSIAGTLPSIPSEPSQVRNYIKTRTYTSDDETKFLDAVQYFDGLGRPNQQVQVGVTPSQKDLISLQEYDAFGREAKSWLPVPKDNNKGAYSENMVTLAGAAYSGDTVPYTEPVYESSPLNRIVQQYGPGQDWRRNGGHPVKTDYLTNNSAHPCSDYSVSGDNLIYNNNYAANSLCVTQMTNEDNKVSYEFKDKLGRVVLQRQMNYSAVPHDTYYVYDDWGNLRYVLPPLAADSAKLKTTSSVSDSYIARYAYIYKYDNRNRCIEKKLPGADPVYYIYDKADRVIFSQDGNQREQRGTKKWTFTLPDALGRMVLQGTCTNPPDSITGVVKATYGANATGIFASFKYTLSGVSFTLDQTYQALYYDHWDNLLNTLDATTRGKVNYASLSGYDARYVNSDCPACSSKGLLVGTRAKMLDDTSKEIVTAFYYDAKGRVVQQKSTNLLNGSEAEYYARSFTGQPTKKQMVHTVPGKSTITEIYTYDYDHADRLTTTTYKLGENDPVALSTLVYDEKGRVSDKKLSDDKLPVTYSYNIRNWLKTISSTHFNETLYYAENSYSSYNGNTVSMQWDASYNGDISSLEWTTSPHPNLQRYSFRYDDLNRLAFAGYYSASTADVNKPYCVESDYDKMGNITYLKRYNCMGYAPGTFHALYSSMDDLDISYSGNQLSKVVESGNSNEGFVKPSGTAQSEYDYNKNGALRRDFNRGITGIQYNILNLPQNIQFVPGHITKNSYDATGVKRRTVHSTIEYDVDVPAPEESEEEEWIPAPEEEEGESEESENIPPPEEEEDAEGVRVDLTTDYCGHIVYENGALKYILNQEGYVTKNGSNYVFNYYMKDHLGNNRIVVAVSGNSHQAVQATDYDPFGMPFPNGVNPERQPYKFGGKELDEMHGLNWYDFEARQKDAILPMFTTMDPLAEKYYSVSPYAYCGNNPVRYIDPTGMEFTEAAWKQVNRLIDDINKRQQNNSNDIAKKQAQIDAGGLSDKKVAKLQKQIDKLNGSTTELEGVRGEVATLAASSQMYDIKNDNSMNIEGAIPGTGEYRSGAAFNTNSGNFEILLGDGSLGSLAHELKHAYQFETGAFSSGNRRDGVPFYDKTDEWEGYSRGSLFGAPRIYSLPSIYDNLQSGPMDATKLAPIILSNPAELQKLAERTKSVFRTNGKTYIGR
jgi:RHS repeat-associated protein